MHIGWTSGSYSFSSTFEIILPWVLIQKKIKILCDSVLKKKRKNSFILNKPVHWSALSYQTSRISKRVPLANNKSSFIQSVTSDLLQNARKVLFHSQNTDLQWNNLRISSNGETAHVCRAESYCSRFKCF